MGENGSLVHANIKLCRLMPKYSPALSYSLFAFFVFVYFLCDLICLLYDLICLYMCSYLLVCALICFLCARTCVLCVHI